jgi:hypothetical protein
MVISVADTGELDVDEDLIGAGLSNGDLLVDRGSTSLLDDLGPLLGRDRHVDRFVDGRGWKEELKIED